MRFMKTIYGPLDRIKSTKSNEPFGLYLKTPWAAIPIGVAIKWQASRFMSGNEFVLLTAVAMTYLRPLSQWHIVTSVAIVNRFEAL